MARTSPNRNRPPLDETTLSALALHYLGRYATTRARLRDYLARKLKERGWAGERAADLDAVVGRMAELGYVDDRLFAAQRGAALARRGYGARRQADALRAAGVSAEDAAAAMESDETDEAADPALASALAFARRKRLGPYAAETVDDPAVRQRQMGAMLRAGHDYALARRVLACAPGEVPE